MEKLAISFWIWAPFDNGNNVYHDCEARMKELRERGFNCVRLEDCAGLFNEPDGTPRGEVFNIRPPFGIYSRNVRQSNILMCSEKINVRQRLLDLFRAAKKYGVKIILSTWYYLHTNWMLDEEINEQLFALPTDEKIAYFGRELAAILSFLKENGLLDVVAFAELFNEEEGLPFAGHYRNDLPHDELIHLRGEHEKAYAELKKQFPDVKFAFDVASAYLQEELIPRNVDVFNFHSYYLWSIMNLYENGLLCDDLSEPDYPESSRKYMKPESEWVTVADVLAARGKQRTGLDWNRRCSLYENLDPEKFPQLEKDLEEILVRDRDMYFWRLKDAVYRAKDICGRILPGALIVMGEGVTYCCGNNLLFEEHSRTYWDLVEQQMKFLNEAGLYGAICRTTSGPEDPSWTTNVEDYKRVNAAFLAE